MAKIPLEKQGFEAEDLEKFVLSFLNTGVRLTVENESGIEERRVLRAWRSNPNGGVPDQGVDVVAKMEGGKVWGFQCKLKTRGQSGRWTLAESKEAVTEATYPADHYCLVVIAPNGSQREAIDFIEKKTNWAFWDADVLSSQFLGRVPLEKQLPILEEFFGKADAAKCMGLLQDEVLIPSSRFFQATTNEKQAFNHLTPLIGRRDLIESLHRFVESSSLKVLLVVARGGEGKSRALREFSIQFAERHEGRELRFVNPYSKDSAEDSLGILLQKGLVVVHEDAHRTETLRSQVLAAVSGDEKAKLILTARPQGVEAIRGVLRDHGIGAELIELQSGVNRLSASEMVELAEAVLGPKPSFEPRHLAELADRSPLICVVGGNLIRMATLSPLEIRDAQSFRDNVFNRLEQQNIDSISGGDPQRRGQLKQLMRALAILAPLPAGRETEKALAKFMRIRASELEERLVDLEVAEIASRTEQGWRIGPDLFADHLVYTTAVRADGTPSAFFEEIIEAFGAEHFVTMLRNLSEAEWRSRLSGRPTTDLTESLWRRFKKAFEESSFWERGLMLDSWSEFGVFLPEKSLELARLSIDLDTAPKQDEAFIIELAKAGPHWLTLEKVPKVLRPIGLHHLEFQSDVFDILARLGIGWQSDDPTDRGDGGHPWSAIGKASTYAARRPIDTVGGVIRWLRSRLSEEWMADLIDRRCSFLSAVLRPIFGRAVQRTYSEGMKVVFQTLPLIVENTERERRAAFKLIESNIIPRSEIAALNIIPVIHAAISADGNWRDSSIDLTKWTSVRLAAIDMSERCLAQWDSPFMRFSVWQALATCIPFEHDQLVIQAIRRVLGTISRDAELSLALAILGDNGEMLLEDDLKVEPDYEKSWNRWKEFPNKVAEELLNSHDSAEKLIQFLEEFDRAAAERGYTPNWSSILLSLANANQDVGSKMVEVAFAGKHRVLKKHIGLLVGRVSASDEQQDQWLAQAINEKNEHLRASALDTFRWRGDSPGPKALKAIKALLRSEDDDDRMMVIRTLCGPIGGGRDWVLPLFAEMRFDELDDKALSLPVASLVKAVRYEHLQISLETLRPLLRRLERVHDINGDPFPAFLQIVTELAPRETYDLLRKRIEAFDRDPAARRLKGGVPRFVPSIYTLEPWSIPGLEREDDFGQIVEFLIGQVRNTRSPSALYWRSLFQAAVLMTSPEHGVRALRTWLDQAKDGEEIYEIASIFNVKGTTLVYSEPEFVKAVLVAAMKASSEGEKRVRFALIPQAGIRGYSNGELDQEYHYVLDEARKATAAHADDDILKPFFDFIIEHEMRDREFHLADYQNSMVE